MSDVRTDRGDTPAFWLDRAKALFAADKPEHFTNYRHCCECAEHDEELLRRDVDTIGLEDLGNPGWDPLCFSSMAGLKYYLPAMVRLTLETMDTVQYVASMLFHLVKDGPGNDLVLACNRDQRAFVAAFLVWLIENHAGALDEAMCADNALRAHEIWSAPQSDVPAPP